jgi:hypothetical protein
VSTAVRLGLLIALIAIVLALLLGPAWRGNFYRSWLRPRLVVFGVIVALLAAGEYIFRVVNAIKSH